MSARVGACPEQQEVTTPHMYAHAGFPYFVRNGHPPLWICGAGVVTLCLLAALLHWWVAPLLARLPSDYVADVAYLGQAETRLAPDGPAEIFQSVIRRHDQVLSGDDAHVMLQGNVHWLTPGGAVIFETLNLYGVDRHTRENLVGYGNLDRRGQYLFPPHTRKQGYILWDPNYAGPINLRFAAVENFRGVEVYVFFSSVDALDETAGFTSLPNVPQRYHASTYGRGKFWVEPVSGVVVNHEDSGTSYFTDARSGLRVGRPIIQWRQHYPPETISAQLKRAKAQRLWMRTLETGLPLLLLAGAVLWPLLTCRRKGRP